jgi:hypothetical protein
MVMRRKFCQIAFLFLAVIFPLLILSQTRNASTYSFPGILKNLKRPREGYLFQPFKPFHITRLDPGESLTVPVDLFSHSNYTAVPEDPETSYSDKDVYHWMELYSVAEFSFVVSGGRTVKYRANTENGPHLEEQFVNDGMGIYYKSPKRSWMDDPFVVP